MLHILGFGNSLTAGYCLPVGKSFVDQLQNKLHSNGFAVSTTNAGISGDTTTGGLLRIDYHLQDNPELIILELGANDGLMGFDTQRTQDNLEKIIQKCLSIRAKVLLAGINLPIEMGGKNYVTKFNAIFSTLAQKYQLLLYDNFLKGVRAKKTLTLFDRFHPNTKGVKVIVEGIYPLLLNLINQIRK